MAIYHLPCMVNTMADLASCSFHTYPTNSAFLTHFTSLFYLLQGNLWLLCHLPSSLSGKIYSVLQTTKSTLEWWLQTTNNTTITGATGALSSCPISTHTFRTHHVMTRLQSYKLSSNGCIMDNWAMDTKSRQDPSKTQSQPSKKPLNWLGLPTPSTSQAW